MFETGEIFTPPPKKKKSHMLRSVWKILPTCTMEHLGIPWSIWESHGASGNPMGHLGIPWSIWESHEASGNPMEHLGIPWGIWESHGASGNPMGHMGIPWSIWEFLNKFFQNRRSHEPYAKVISLKRSSCMVMNIMRLLNFKQHIISYLGTFWKPFEATNLFFGHSD